MQHSFRLRKHPLAPVPPISDLCCPVDHQVRINREKIRQLVSGKCQTQTSLDASMRSVSRYLTPNIGIQIAIVTLFVDQCYYPSSYYPSLNTVVQRDGARRFRCSPKLRFWPILAPHKSQTSLHLHHVILLQAQENTHQDGRRCVSHLTCYRERNERSAHQRPEHSSS